MPGGKIILEILNPKQLKNNSGDPKDLSMLYTIDVLETKTIELNEGKHHQGKADIIQFVATK
ncbi:MAG: hypothetical protein Q7U59_07190 [Lutibacter sp.]|nr:hypothetical protein [Lutibacter sp.]MDP3359341.1 hypothetical protein [Lutibacter sp.]